MKKLLLILLCLPIVFNSCRKCKDCALTFETEYDTNALDSIVQNIHNSDADIPSWVDSSANYLDWNEYISLSYPSLNQEDRQCNPDLEEYVEHWEEEFWDLDTMDNYFYIGRFYYNCK